MRKVITILVAIMMAFVLSVNTFAIAYPNTGITIENGNTIVGIVDTASASAEVKQFLLDFLQATSGRAIIANTTGSAKSFTFMMNTTFQYTQTNYVNVSKDTKAVSFVWDAETSMYKPSKTTVSTYNNAAATEMTTVCVVMYDGNISGMPNNYWWDYQGELIMRDNDGLLSPDDGGGGVEDPEIPSAPPAVNFPEIGPTDNEYVPYDTTVWNTFLDWVTNAIGNSTNIGLVLFAYIFGILVVIAIVKKFTKTKS